LKGGVLHQSQSLIEKETVFKTQGQSYNIDDLIKSTLLKEPVLESIVPNIYEKVMTKAEVHLKNIITYTALAPQFAHLDVLRLYVSLHCLV
jgi:hypothetical protein